MKRAIALTEAGGTIRWEHGALEVDRPGAGAQAISLDTVEEIILVGRVEITAAALRRCLRAEVPVIVLDGLGRYLGRIIGPTRRHAALRIAQMQASLDTERATNLVRAIIQTKVRNQRALLLRRQRDLQNVDLGRALVRLRLLENDLVTAPSIEVLRGLEGAAAAAYFGVFGILVRNPTFPFEGRNRRPPRDPINAMLSFGYTVLGSLVEGEVEASGLDPAIGFLHLPHYGRPSLMLDLLEELRPAVDRLTLRLVNRGQMTPADFGPPDKDDDLAFEDLMGLAQNGPLEAEAHSAVWPDSPEDHGRPLPTAGESGESAGASVLAFPQLRSPLVPALEPQQHGTAAAMVGGAPKRGAVYLRAQGRKLFLAALFEMLRETVFDPVDDSRISLRLAIRRQTWRFVQCMTDPQLPYIGLKLDP